MDGSCTTFPDLARLFHNFLSKVPEGHHPRGTTLREALLGNLPSVGVSQRALRGSLRGFLRGLSCGGPQDFPRFFGGRDPMLVTIGDCWISYTAFLNQRISCTMKNPYTVCKCEKPEGLMYARRLRPSTSMTRAPNDMTCFFRRHTCR